MRTERKVEIEEVEYEYFCDICKERIRVDCSHDERISDHMDKCPLCGREVCHSCIVYIPSLSHGYSLNNTLCSTCGNQYQSILDNLSKNMKRAYETEKKLYTELYSHKQI